MIQSFAQLDSEPPEFLKWDQLAFCMCSAPRQIAQIYTAQLYGLTIVSKDQMIAGYSGVAALWA
jgi:hypothetical protein